MADSAFVMLSLQRWMNKQPLLCIVLPFYEFPTNVLINTRCIIIIVAVFFFQKHKDVFDIDSLSISLILNCLIEVVTNPSVCL